MGQASLGAGSDRPAGMPSGWSGIALAGGGEDYHQGLKTGCRLEERHLQTYEGVRRLLGLLSPLAVRLLQLRWAARQTPWQAAAEVLPASVVQVVAALADSPPAELSVEQAWHTIARYGGYLGRKGDGPPGWKTLWKGWFYIQAVLEGVQLAARLPLEPSSFP
jgi:Transposase Tn5 dimerisation domain